jgi:hypothetical protein
VIVVGAAWTSLSLRPSGILAGLTLFGLCSALVVGVLRDGGSRVSWVAVPATSVGCTALLGPWSDTGLLVLPVVGAMVATSPGVRAVRGHRRATLPPRSLSDWELEALWTDTESELRHTTAPADEVLRLVLLRAELLDELLRRHGEPHPH